MKRKMLTAVLVLLVCLLAAGAAMAQDVFRFATDSVKVYDGESVTPELLRDGKFAEGDVVFSSRGPNKAAVDENGTITGVEPGQVYVQANLMKDGKTVRYCSILVTVIRKATKVTLDGTNLMLYDPDDEKVLPLLRQDPDAGPLKNRVLVVAAGKRVYLRTIITPTDVREKHVTFTTDDAGIANVQKDGNLIAVQRGECNVTIASVQSPEVTETIHVVVIEPMKKVVITAPEKTIAAGRTMQLGTEITPDTTTIQTIQWRSRDERIATVDQDGLVTGVGRGSVVIEAKSTDGSNLTATFYLTVSQDVTEVTLKETETTVATGRTVQLHATVLPNNANNRQVTWTSSDESVATVRNGAVTGRKAGECTVTCASVSNPEISATIPVRVIQMVTDIQFVTQPGLQFHIGDSRELEWRVLPEDASIKDVTFKSRAPSIAVVDQNGIVTGLAKGQADIEVKATDGSGKYRVYRVTILKPVEGIEPLATQYYAQINRYTDIRTKVIPSDASDQKVLWEGSDDYIASVTNAGTNTGRVLGRQRGTITLTGTAEDGGFSTSTTVIVDDFDGMAMVGGAYIDENNKIRIVIWNMSRDYYINLVHFKVECYDTQGYRMVCNTDGVSTSFEGNYPLQLAPGGRSEHGRFNFFNYQDNGWYGYVVVTITGFEFDNGQKWWLPEDKQVPYRSTESSHWGEPTFTPDDPEESNG